MAALLIDSPAPADAAPADAAEQPAPAAGQVPSESAHTCAKCGAPMSPGQEWCLQCGAGAPGSLASGGWRSITVILAATAVLALMAAGAAVAALSKHSTHKVTTVALAPPVTTTPTTPPVTPNTTPIVPSTPKTTAVVPPKIPITPTTTPTTPANTTPTTPANTTPSETGGAGEGSETKPSALLLDTNAASTYNPYSYPAAGFGDPSLTIDGDTTTAWTAQVEPDKAPRMAVGVLLKLGSSSKLSALELITSTPGMRVQVYGSTAHTPPSSITDKSWVAISHSLVVAKKHTRLKILSPTKGYSLVVLWISQAPASAVGTAAAPGYVAVNELELFPAG